MESKRYKIKIINHQKKENHIVYEGILTDITNNIDFTFFERYSNLKVLNDLMKKESSNSNFPKFPPRKFFGSGDEKFLLKRQQDLNTYFEMINENEELSKLPSLLKFIEGKIKNNIANNTPYSRQNINNSHINYSRTITNLKSEIKILSYEDMKKGDKESSKIVENYKNRFVDLDYDIPQNFSEDNEIKYNQLIKNEKILNQDSIKNSFIFTIIEPGNDTNFEYIGKNDKEFIEKEDILRKKIESTFIMCNNLSNIYETSEILLKL